MLVASGTHLKHCQIRQILVAGTILYPAGYRVEYE